MHVTLTVTLENVLKRHEEVFKDELGTVRGIKVSIHVDTDARPRFYKVRPFLMRSFDQEIERLQ